MVDIHFFKHSCLSFENISKSKKMRSFCECQLYPKKIGHSYSALIHCIGSFITFKFFKIIQQGLLESKLRAFDIGNMSLGTKTLSKREQEEMKRKVSLIKFWDICSDYIIQIFDVKRNCLINFYPVDFWCASVEKIDQKKTFQIVLKLKRVKTTFLSWYIIKSDLCTLSQPSQFRHVIAKI